MLLFELYLHKREKKRLLHILNSQLTYTWYISMCTLNRFCKVYQLVAILQHSHMVFLVELDECRRNVDARS